MESRCRGSPFCVIAKSSFLSQFLKNIADALLEFNGAGEGIVFTSLP